MQTDAYVFKGSPVSLDPAVADPVVTNPVGIDPAVIDPTALAPVLTLTFASVNTSIQSPLVNWLP